MKNLHFQKILEGTIMILFFGLIMPAIVNPWTDIITIVLFSVLCFQLQQRIF